MMSRFYWIIHWISFLFLLLIVVRMIETVSYDQPCTFSLNDCHWNIGRRWQIGRLDDEIEDQVLMATGQSEDDERLGYTDSVISSRLTLVPTCSFHLRIIFQFYIELEQDRIEVFLLKRNGTRVLSLGQWKGLIDTNRSNTTQIESNWQQANLTLLAAEEFRIDIEVRHVPNENNKTASWFAIDDILIENCPDDPRGIVKMENQNRTATMTILSSWTTPSYWRFESRNSFNRSFYRFRWKFNNSFDDSSSVGEFPSASRFTFITFIIYFFTTLIGLAFVTLISAMIVFAYRKYCFPSLIIRNRSCSSEKRTNFIRFGRGTRAERTMMTEVQTLS